MALLFPVKGVRMRNVYVEEAFRASARGALCAFAVFHLLVECIQRFAFKEYASMHDNDVHEVRLGVERCVRRQGALSARRGPLLTSSHIFAQLARRTPN